MGKARQFAAPLKITFLMLFLGWFGVLPQPTALADQGTNDNGGFGSSLARAISNFQQALPSIFQELSAEDIGVKPRLRPHFDFSNSFASNVDLGRSHDDPAYIARTAVGMTLELPVGSRLYSELDYTFAFATTQGRKTDANTITHNVSGLANYELTDNTVLGLKDKFQVSEVPGGGGNLFYLNTADAELSHKFGAKLDAVGGYRFQWFDDDETFVPSTRYIDNGVHGTLNYAATKLITVSPYAKWHTRNFGNNLLEDRKEYREMTLGGGLSYRLGHSTVISGHGGWNHRKFKGGPGEDDNSIIWGATLTHNLGRKLVWSVDYQKAVQDTFDTGFVDRVGAEVTTLDNLDRNFRMVTTQRVEANSTYHLNEKNSFGLFGALLLTDADEQDNLERARSNDETTLEAGVSYSYRINRYLAFVLRYVFGRRFTSDDPGSGRENFTFHKATGGLSVRV